MEHFWRRGPWIAEWNHTNFERQYAAPWAVSSVTRLGDLLDFGQVFKAFGNN